MATCQRCNPLQQNSGFSTVQCTGLIVREPRRVVRCGGESTHIAVQLTNDDVRRPAEWRWRRPACSCFGAASLANERSRLDSASRVTVSTCKAQRYFTWAEIQFRRTPSYWEGGHFPTRFVYQHLSYLYLNSYARARYSVLFSLVNLYLNSYARARYSFLFCLFCGERVLMVQSWPP